MVVGAKKRLTIDWFILSVITVMFWWKGSRHGHQVFTLNALITFSVIAIAAIKVRIIIAEFMEARAAPVLLRKVTDAWLTTLIVTLLVIYVVGTRLHT